MSYFEKIRKVIEEFCNTTPASGFEISYLENAKEIYELYAEANQIIQESKEDSRLSEIYEEIISLA